MDHRVEIKESQKLYKYLNLARELNNCEHDGNGNSICWGYSTKEPGERTGNQWENRNHPDYRIAEIYQNTEKSPGDPRRLAVT